MEGSSARHRASARTARRPRPRPARLRTGEPELRQVLERRRLLVTGCARSGTAYAAVVWRSQGLDVRHEMPVPPEGVMGRDGIASWYLAVDDPAPPYGPSRRGVAFDLVIHQVRDPLLVIPAVAQFVLRNRPSRAYIARHAPATIRMRDLLRPPRRRLLLRAMRYWQRWNLLASAIADETVRVESLVGELPRLCERLGVPFVAGEAERVRTDVNARGHYVQGRPWRVGWEDLGRLDPALAAEVRALAGSYGYPDVKGAAAPDRVGGTTG